MTDHSCPISSIELTGIEVVTHPEAVGTFEKALELANAYAKERFEEYMLISWYDADRDFESPPHSTECNDCPKNGYIHYAINHDAKLKVDFENGRFIFFFTPLDW